MFSVGDRDDVARRVVSLVASDPRAVAGALVGSLADDEGDRWSDLDLMFAVQDDVSPTDALQDWTGSIVREFEAVHLLDLPTSSIIYRVFLLPGCLELDLSVTRASAFGAGGPKFRLLFGEAVALDEEPPTPAHEMFGHAVHHALHARVAIERGRFWQAEYWISAVRDYGLGLACRHRGLDGWYGRDFDRLPSEVLRPFEDALVRSLTRDELLRALASAVNALLRESIEVGEMVDKVERQLRDVASVELSSR